jgi:DNA relaxase NicK
MTIELTIEERQKYFGEVDVESAKKNESLKEAFYRGANEMCCLIDTLSVTGRYYVTLDKLRRSGKQVSEDLKWEYMQHIGARTGEYKEPDPKKTFEGSNEVDLLSDLLYERIGCVVYPGTATNGYQRGYNIVAADSKVFEGVFLGHINVGGNKKKDGADTWQIYLNGSGMQYINVRNMITKVYDLVCEFDMDIKRVDVALDDYEGVCSVDTVLKMYNKNLFTGRGKKPKLNQVGDWQSGADGRTVYVGSRQSVYYHRSYEKGKQKFGSVITKADKKRIKKSGVKINWVRHELEIKTAGVTNIPREVLMNPDMAFCNNKARTEIYNRVTKSNMTKNKGLYCLRAKANIFNEKAIAWMQTVSGVGVRIYHLFHVKFAHIENELERAEHLVKVLTDQVTQKNYEQFVAKYVVT